MFRKTILTIAVGLASAMAPAAHASEACGRQCLEGLVDRYLAAMAAHDPEQLPWARQATFTENGQELRIGDGLWATASAVGHYKLIVADPEDGQVGFYGTMFENGTPVYLALRLKVDYGLISEAETIVARASSVPGLANAGEAMEKRAIPRPQFSTDIPAKERASRAQLVRVANSYFTGLGGNTGTNTAPFWPSCTRLENGTQTTNNPRPGVKGMDILAMGCEAQQRSGFFSFVTGIRDRRFPVVDRERGLVMAFAFFDHQGALKEVHLTDGTTIPAMLKSPLTFEISELFQIHGGKIDQVEAVLDTVPYGMRSAVWDAPHAQQATDDALEPGR